MASALSMTTMRARARAHRGWRAACVAGAWLAAASASATVGGPLEGDARLESDGHRRRLLASSTSTAHDLALRFSVPQPPLLSHPTKRATASVQLQPFATAKWLPPASTAALGPHVAAALPTKPIQREYELQGVVGEGGFGCVHAARHRATNTRVALKRVFKASTTRAKFLQEVAILRHVCRPSDSENASGSGASGVLQLHDAFETADAYVLVTELVPGGELFDAVVETGALTESCASTLIRDVAATLAFLHAKRVVHGDVKPENILLSDRGSSTRLIDFGQAFRDDNHNNRNHDREETFTVGTTAYAAPEVLSRGDASAAADAWALGVVLYIMLCGRHPFDETNDASDEEMAARIRVGAFACESAHWQQLSAPARDLVQRLLTVDPRVRLTAEQVLQHEWIMRTSSASRQAMEA